MKLKFASYNIHKAVGIDRRRDPDRILAVLREVNADVIALQEVDMRLGARASVIPRAALDDTPWRAVPVARRPRSLGWHGNALLVRRDMEIVEAEALDLPTLEPRGAAGVVVRIGDQSIRAIGTHLDLSGLRRRDQVRALLDHIASAQETLPTVIMGDFNQWGRMTGAMREFAPNWQVISPGRSFPSRRPLARLDRIVASADWAVEKDGVHHSSLAAIASDHLPVEVILALHKKWAGA